MVFAAAAPSSYCSCMEGSPAALQDSCMLGRVTLFLPSMTCKAYCTHHRLVCWHPFLKVSQSLFTCISCGLQRSLPLCV
jgi:hypothetical protein